MRKTLLLLLLTAVFCGAFARKTPQVAPAPQVPDSLRGFYLFTEGIKQAFIERDTAAARASLERSVEADSTYGPAWYELAELLLYNDAPAALRHAERAFRTDTTDKWYLLQLGQAQILNDRYRDAIRTYNRLREVDAQNPDSYRVLAMLYDQEGQPFSAIAVLDSAEVRFGRIDALSELKRRLLVGTRQYDRAVAEAQALIEAAPYKAENHLLLGELYARQKKDSLALVQFAEAYRIDSTSVAVLATYSEFYNERRDYASSLNYTRRLFASDEMPLDDKLAYFDRITGDRNFYSTFYLQINDLATTLAMKYPHDPRVVKLYGDHLIASGQLDDALTYYKTHLDDLPPRIDYFNMVIDIESYKQRLDSVERYTSRAMKLFPENVDLHLRKGQMLSYAKRYDEALKFYKNSLRLAPGDSLRGAVWGIIGETYHLMGQQALQKRRGIDGPKRRSTRAAKAPRHAACASATTPTTVRSRCVTTTRWCSTTTPTFSRSKGATWNGRSPWRGARSCSKRTTRPIWTPTHGCSTGWDVTTKRRKPCSRPFRSTAAKVPTCNSTTATSWPRWARSSWPKSTGKRRSKGVTTTPTRSSNGSAA